MVATVIARLAEAGQLSLDDPVVAHVPELGGSGWARRVTLRDLLANRSGLPLRAGLEFDFVGRRDEDDGALSRLSAAERRAYMAAMEDQDAMPEPTNRAQRRQLAKSRKRR